MPGGEFFDEMPLDLDLPIVVLGLGQKVYFTMILL